MAGEKTPDFSRREAKASNLSVRTVTEVMMVRFDSTTPEIVTAVAAPCVINSSTRASIARKLASRAVQRDSKVATALRRAITSSETGVVGEVIGGGGGAWG